MALHTYPPPEPRTIPPPTNNSLSFKERSALVRSTKKIGRMLGDIPRFIDDIEDQFVMVTPPGAPTPAGPSKEDTWRSRKPTHLPPLMKLSGGVAMDSSSLRTAPARRASIVSTSTSSSKSSIQEQLLIPSKEAAHKRSKMERLRRRLGEEVPMEAVFPSTSASKTAVPHTAMPERSRNHNQPRSVHPSHDDTVTFSIDHHTVVLKTSTRANRPHSPHSHRSHHSQKSTHRQPPLPMTGLPPLPKPKHPLVSDETSLLGVRVKAAAGSKIGGADFKAARHAKREGFGEVEMVGFMGGF